MWESPNTPVKGTRVGRMSVSVSRAEHDRRGSCVFGSN